MPCRSTGKWIPPPWEPPEDGDYFLRTRSKNGLCYIVRITDGQMPGNGWKAYRDYFSENHHLEIWSEKVVWPPE